MLVVTCLFKRMSCSTEIPGKVSNKEGKNIFFHSYTCFNFLFANYNCKHLAKHEPLCDMLDTCHEPEPDYVDL